MESKKSLKSLKIIEICKIGRFGETDLVKSPMCVAQHAIKTTQAEAIGVVLASVDDR